MFQHCEICCLTTRVGIAPEIVRDGENGLLLPFNDPLSFVGRTLALVENEIERKRLGQNARQTILKKMHTAVTSQLVRDVYVKAFENFEQRSHRTSKVHIEALTASTRIGTSDKEEVAVPLHGFPPAIHARVRMLESLCWAEHLLLYHQQRAVASKLILREWVRHPTSQLPPRVLLRRLLPASLVARIVRLKGGSPRLSPIIAKYSASEKL